MERFFRAAERPELATDNRSTRRAAAPSTRGAHPLLAEILGRTHDGRVAAPSRTGADVLVRPSALRSMHHQQVVARGLITRTPPPQKKRKPPQKNPEKPPKPPKRTRVRSPGNRPRAPPSAGGAIRGHPSRTPSPAPAIGAHVGEILADWAMPARHRTDWRESGRAYRRVRGERYGRAAHLFLLPIHDLEGDHCRPPVGVRRRGPRRQSVV